MAKQAWKLNVRFPSELREQVAKLIAQQSGLRKPSKNDIIVSAVRKICQEHEGGTAK